MKTFEIIFIYTELSYGSKAPEIQKVLKNLVDTKILNKAHHFLIDKKDGDEEYLKKYFDNRKLGEMSLALIIDKVIKPEFHRLKHDEWIDMIKFNYIRFTTNITDKPLHADFSGMTIK